MKKLISMVSMSVLALSVSATALASSEGVVDRSVNFRSAPSTNSQVYGTLKAGTTLTILDAMNAGWTKISVGGKVGYVSDHYISATSSGPPAPAPTPPAPEPAPPTSPPAPSDSSTADRIIQNARDLQGVTRYAFGVNRAPNALDCSAFTKYVFGQQGISLKWGTRYQKSAGSYVSKSNLKKGDLVFFWTSRQGTINHVGIYIGDGQFIHNSPSLHGVGISSLDSGYWEKHYISARRVL